jgi:hypothetical protein
MPSIVTAPSYIALLKKYDFCSEDVKKYFGLLPQLIKDYPHSVSLAYIFFETEKAQNRVLYGGVVKLHRGNAKTVENLVYAAHIKRESFLTLFRNVFDKELSQPVVSKLKVAEKTRDKLLHGKKVTDASLREAIADVLDYADAMNNELDILAGFKPFGDMRGFKGRKEALDAKTTRWLMKGLGFPAS